MEVQEKGVEVQEEFVLSSGPSFFVNQARPNKRKKESVVGTCGRDGNR